MADRYLVAGGTGNWNSTTNWSTTDGGASGASFPVTGDNVFCTPASGATTLTVNTSSVCANFDATGFTGTLAGSSGLTIESNLTLGAGMTRTYTGAIIFSATSTGRTITSAGIALDSTVTFDGVGGEWSLTDAFVTGATRSVLLTNGAFDANGQAVTAGLFNSSNSNVRTLTQGDGQWTITGNNASVWSTATATNFTLNRGALPFKFTYSGATGTRSITTNGVEGQFPSIWISAGTDTVSLNGAHDLDFTGFSGTLAATARTIFGSLTLGSGMTVTAAGSNTTFGATSGTKTITTNGVTIDTPMVFDGVGGTWQLGDNLTQGSSRLFTLTNGTFKLNNFNATIGFFSSSNSNVRTLDLTGGTLFIAGNSSTVYSTDTNTNLTLVRGSNPVTLTYSGGVGTRTVQTGINALEEVTPNILIQAGTDAFASGASRPLRDLNFGAFAGTWNAISQSIFGHLTLSAAMTVAAGSNTVTMAPATGTTKILTSNGVTINRNVAVNGTAPVGTVQLADALTVATANTLTVSAGGFDANNFNVTAGLFSSSTSNVRSITMGSGQWTITGNAATIWSMSNVVNLTFTPAALPVVFNYSGSTGTRTLSVGALTEAQVFSIHVSAGSDLLVVSGSGGQPYNDINFTGYSGQLQSNNRTVYGNATYSSNMTFGTGAATVTMAATSGTKSIQSNGNTVNENITINGAGGTFQLADALNLGPTTRTLTLTAGTFDANDNNVTVTSGFSSSNSNVRSLLMGDGVWTLSGVGNIWSTGTTTNIAVTPGASSLHLTSPASGARAFVGFGAAVDYSGNDIVVSAGTGTLSFGGGGPKMRHLDFTGFTGSLTPGTFAVHGDITLDPGMSIPDTTASIQMAGTSGVQLMTTNGVIVGTGIVILGIGGTTRLADDLTTTPTRRLRLLAGTFDANDFDVSIGDFRTDLTDVRVLEMGDGTWTLNEDDFGGGVVWNVVDTTDLTINAGTSTIKVVNASATNKRFIGAGAAGNFTYNNIWLTGSGAGVFQIEGAAAFCTFNDFKVDTPPHTILFDDGFTMTVNSFTGDGEDGSPITIGSITGASNHNLIKAGGGQVRRNHLSVSRSTGRPIATWYGDEPSVNGGHNVDWTFTAHNRAMFLAIP